MHTNITAIVNTMLEKGLVVHGEIKLDRLTFTSVSHAKSLGILPNDSGETGQFHEEETNSHLEPKHEILTNEAVTREEFTAMMDELQDLKAMLKASQYGLKEKKPSSRR